ncbi:MAG: YhbD family protein [Saccharofermentans sp.]|jgi:DNA-binding transcriptional MerR regulator|nr:YhbD family protein [Mageeibacillus sp.]MCI1264798.1 YhbD family protein [Saccharofermentans sp.]MCI1275473.1 YhbD family protein [Saccharofermentans sp.]MCI1769409.1 YhbD family protein [Mageeibacillus sp.]MCI2044514.1 YhbD family protein [Mageeibacillus sp.]
MDDKLISKKELLSLEQISYGTLYRWKRQGLIPESWFIHRATDIGQATFFPEEKIVARIERIKELKNELSVDQMQELFSANVESFKIPLKDFRDLELVGKMAVTAFTSVFPKKDVLDFNDVFGMYVVDHLMKLSGIYLEDGKQVLRLLCKYLSAEASKEYQLLLLRKMGVPMTVLVRGGDEILLEDNTEVIACANLGEFEEALKDQLIA